MRSCPNKNETIKSTNKFSIITICNWDTYQSQDLENDQLNDQQLTNKRPTTDHIQEGIKKDKKDKNTIPQWRTDYDVYYSECNAAFDVLLEDWNWIAEKKEYYSGVLIRKSLEKMFFEYWGTRSGWIQKKKARSTETIDWKRTIEIGLSKPFNKVWLKKGEVDPELEYLKACERRSEKNAI